MSDEKVNATPVSNEHPGQARNLADDFRPREPTTSIDPYVFDG